MLFLSGSIEHGWNIDARGDRLHADGLFPARGPRRAREFFGNAEGDVEDLQQNARKTSFHVALQPYGSSATSMLAAPLSARCHSTGGGDTRMSAGVGLL